MRKLLFVAALVLATPAYAKDVTITMNDQEQKVFLALLDTALKQGGLANLQVVLQFVQKYKAAVEPSEVKPEPKK